MIFQHVLKHMPSEEWDFEKKNIYPIFLKLSKLVYFCLQISIIPIKYEIYLSIRIIILNVTENISSLFIFSQTIEWNLSCIFWRVDIKTLSNIPPHHILKFGSAWKRVIQLKNNSRKKNGNKQQFILFYLFIFLHNPI